MWDLVAFTAGMGVLALSLILVPGVALALLLARKKWWGKSLVETAVSLPLVLPPVATGLILLELLSRKGLLGPLLAWAGWDVIFTWKAVVAAMAVMSFPFLVRSSRTAFESVDPRLEGMARTLGAGPWRVFFRVTLPLASRGLGAGLVLSFARSLGEFGATILVAGNIPGRTTTLPVRIFQCIELGQDGEATRLMLCSVAVAFLALWFSDRIARLTDPTFKAEP